MVMMPVLIGVLIVVLRPMVMVDGWEPMVQVLLVFRVECMMVGQVSSTQNRMLMEVDWLDVVLVVPLMVKLGVVAQVLTVMMGPVEEFISVLLLLVDREVMVVFFTVCEGGGLMIVSMVLILRMMVFVDIERLED